ncbi:hypothetical protein Clacol_009519 [Clathrus columnatus]|uniref:F-box domain-containing protein n=1 Tax=Clathrus columnatus TaxID=1419009 RepID=A0AAV5AP24_9AGAM|nr:hypothetical protein Clacol_009519 [Clathrus columnatus]
MTPSTKCTHFPLVQDLPEDILHEIFSHLHPTLEKSISLREPPLSLTRVSRSWRKVAMDVSSLWTNLVLDRSLGQLDPYGIISMWLTNSKTRLLNVVVQTASWQARVNGEECLRLLVNNFHRFQSFSGRLDLRLEQVIFSHLRYGQIEAPNLVEFSIFFQERLPIPISHLQDCISAPALAVLKLEHCALTELVVSALPHITHLILDPELWSQASADLAFLPKCRNLTTLEMGIHGNMYTPRTQPGERLRFNMLHTLLLHLNRGYNPRLLFDSLSAPNLRRLEVVQKQVMMNDCLTPTLRTSTLYNFMHGSSTNVQYLSLTAIVIDDPIRLRHLLWGLSNLTHLALRQCLIHDPIIIELTPSRMKANFRRGISCPRLTHVDFRGSSFTPGLFIPMIQNRFVWNGFGIDYLRVVDVRCNPPRYFDPVETVSLQQLMRESMGRLEILF